MSAHTSFSRNSTFAFLLVAAITVTSCHKDSSSPITAEPLTSFTDITRTDVTGAVLSVDPDDWKSLVLASGGVDPLFPAYPNPCDTSKGSNLHFRMLSKEFVLVTLNTQPNTAIRNVYFDSLKAGSYVVRIYTNGLAPAIYRVYFKIIRPDTVFTTYGDVQVI